MMTKRDIYNDERVNTAESYKKYTHMPLTPKVEGKNRMRMYVFRRIPWKCSRLFTSWPPLYHDKVSSGSGVPYRKEITRTLAGNILREEAPSFLGRCLRAYSKHQNFWTSESHHFLLRSPFLLLVSLSSHLISQ